MFDRLARCAHNPAPMRAKKTTAQLWLQLLRAPNLFTVPGDPLAGFLLVSGGQLDARLGAAIFASLCFYAHGLLLNDLADLEEDRRERPHRPLPSGAVNLRAVRVVAGLLALLALLACLAAGPLPLYAGFLLLGVVATYNLWSKKIAGLGAANMGLCRGLSLLLGACAGLPADRDLATFPELVWLAAGGLTLYIALVTHLARIETDPDPPKLPRALPFLGLLLAVIPIFLASLDYSQPLRPLNIGLYAISAYTVYAGTKIDRRLTQALTPPIPPIIGQWIRLLLPLQAIWCLASRSFAGSLAAVILLALWPISRQVSRRFYAS